MHPLSWAKEESYKRVFIASLVMTLIVMFVLDQIMGAPLKNGAAAPLGIISLELAGDTVTAQRIMDSWDANAHTWLGVGLGFDYLFMLCYAFCIASACVLSVRVVPALTKVALTLAWLQLVAALCDAGENASLISILVNGVHPTPVAISFYCASVKFTFVLMGIIFSLGIYFYSLLKRK